MKLMQSIRRVAHYLLPPVIRHPAGSLVPLICQRNGRKRFLKAVHRRLPTKAARILERLTGGGLSGDLQNVNDLAERYCEHYWKREVSPADAKAKASDYKSLLSFRLDRAKLSGEIARLERNAGNDLVAALYAIRAMRLSGGRSADDLSWSKRALLKHGFNHEADAIDAMYGPPENRFERCLGLIQAATKRCRMKTPACDFAAYDDERGDVRPRVSVIVSLYNAASKLPVFVQMLGAQTLLRDRQLEVIFVDSNSPADERRAVRECNLVGAVPYLFVRTPERESIQTAWNRGIELARAPYLAFLGVDETVYPRAYEELAAELDAFADVDWVMGNSLVMEVDANGVPVRDVCQYNRAGYVQDLVYLETCYLSWVGGLYRKSIHDRFGYYDGSFRAAGDTEFKSRVLPFIRSRHVPKLLGLFLNYPEERTTASPRAELEDLRAWYLHRTSAGVEYAFGQRNVADLEAMLAHSLHYRKSYSGRLSTDVEYANSVVEVLRRRAPESPALVLADGVERMLAAYQSLDYLPGASESTINRVLQSTVGTLAGVQRQHRNTAWMSAAVYDIFHDNRFEQHTHSW